MSVERGGLTYSAAYLGHNGIRHFSHNGRLSKNFHPMHQPRIGYNAKARASTAGGKKKGKEKRKKHQTDGESNAPIYVPKSDEQKDRERKEKIKQEVYISTPLDLFARLI